MVVTMIATKAVAALERLGLSNYEARAYAALLRSGPVTGYQLSRQSGVPRSRIYEALEKLGVRGMVIVRNERPQLYAAANWQEVLGRRAKEFQISLKDANTCCAAVARQTELEGAWCITGRANIFARVAGMLASASRRVGVVGWATDLIEIEPALAEASRRGVAVRVVACGSFRPNFGEIYEHSLQARCTKELIVCVDDVEALVGQNLPEDSASATWSRESGFVEVTSAYIAHEVFIARLLEHVDPETMKSLGEMYRQIVEGEG